MIWALHYSHPVCPYPDRLPYTLRFHVHAFRINIIVLTFYCSIVSHVELDLLFACHYHVDCYRFSLVQCVSTELSF